MFDTVKKIGVIIAIAVLFCFFAFSVVEVITPNPEYQDYCKNEFYPMDTKALNCSGVSASNQQITECQAQNGLMTPVYDSKGCPEAYVCNTCQLAYDEAHREFRLTGFIVMGIMGVLAILSGLYFKPSSQVLEWIMSGFLIGGVISVFIGTAMYFSDINRFARPIVLLLEIGLIVLIAIKTYLKK
jgi:predicted membrane channel-forming protein YqfA (hemolysin III family)